MSRPAKIIIDLAALQHNVARIREMAPASKIIAMVKSNAYGHGLESIGTALAAEVEALGVACLEEGLMLREKGVTTPSIVLMEGVFQAEELLLSADHRFSLVVHRSRQIEFLEKFSSHYPFGVWLKIDTGMHRLGFNPQDVQSAWLRLMNCSRVKKPIGFMTHFAESDRGGSDGMHRQLELFNKVTANLHGPRSLAKSGAILDLPQAHCDWVRPGIILYGASPWPHSTGMQYGLLPVMSFCSELIAVNKLMKGDSIGYGGIWNAPEDMRVGVVAAGYGDGYPQGAQNGTPVLVNGQRCSTVGRVSMDMLTVDLRGQPDARPGDPVTLWGRGLPAEEVAEYSGSSVYELLTRMPGRRVRVSVEPSVLPVTEKRGETCAII